MVFKTEILKKYSKIFIYKNIYKLIVKKQSFEKKLFLQNLLLK